MIERIRFRGNQSLVALLAVVGLGFPVAAFASMFSVAAEATCAAPAPAGGEEIATLEAAGGQVLVIRLGQSQELASPAPLQVNDIVVTRQGRATVRFHSDGTVVRIGPDSRVQINESAKDRDIEVFLGRVWAHVVRWKERPTRFISGSTIAAMRGTELNVAVDGDETQLSVLEGRVQAENDAGSLLLTGGQVAVVAKGSAPALRVQVRPRDAVRWALYYLPVLSVKPSTFGQGAGWQAKARESSEAYLRGDLRRAISSLENIDVQGVRDPQFFTYRASLMLAAGSVEQAGKDLERALERAPNDSDALALQAIMAVVDNEADKALATAGSAVAADPRSATAQIALSYARQAKFDLEGARESLETAVKLAPDDALAWARLAEIRSSFGNLDQALEAARKAIDLEPNLARTQTVLGYTYLTQVKLKEATKAFRRAVELDPADPLPRLGLGLAKIRDGQLATGSEELEIAVSLDPGQSLVRSYLGKAYFEEKRTALVGREYEVAKESDPKDPTPWFYDALSKQTTNRPVEALRSLQQAIALNDNRAVYRSRLLLDSDLAARGASLGRLYADMGFQDRGLVEGWKSVNTDPSDYSAHRLLADSYSALPRHEIARVSELFQSQMLQPLNTTPIQPSLGEGSLFLVSGQGAGAAGFNEFNRLFNRDQINVQGGFLLGQDSTWSGEGIASGIYKKASFSAGYSGFDTEGFRANATQNDKIANAFGQVEVSPSTSVQAEVRHRKLDKGDLDLRFFPDDFSTLQKQTDESTNYRVGARQAFGPSLTLLASYLHQSKDIVFDLPNPAAGVDFGLTRNEKADSFEGQFLYRSHAFKAVGGAGHFKIASLEDNVLGIPVLGFSSVTTSDTSIDHTNLYGYSYISLPKNVTLTLGMSGDLFDETGTAFESTVIPGLPAFDPVKVQPAVLGSRNQANPKLGILWTSKSRTTLRAAFFGTLKRTLVTDQTLEPTQVAGFNQFFDDPSATKSWVYGAAIDQVFSNSLFGGVELTRRELTIPQTLVGSGGSLTLAERDGKESLARVYLFSAPHERLTLSAEYQYEKIDLDPKLFLRYSRVETHRVPLAVRFFHPSGFGASVSTTYLNQSGDFKPPDQNVYVPGKRDFWIVDAALRYRLPKRYGFVAVGVNNLTNEQVTSTSPCTPSSPCGVTLYQSTDSKNLGIRPGRSAFVRVTLAFP